MRASSHSTSSAARTTATPRLPEPERRERIRAAAFAAYFSRDSDYSGDVTTQACGGGRRVLRKIPRDG